LKESKIIITFEPINNFKKQKMAIKFPLTIDLKERLIPYASDANLYEEKDMGALQFFQRIIDEDGYFKEDWNIIKEYLKGIATHESNTPEIDKDERKGIREKAFDDAIVLVQTSYEQTK
jgi:hypothetical protein